MPHQPNIPHLVAFAEIGSTNDHAKILAREGAAEGTVVWAEVQTAGRGRQGNTWLTVPGNLFMTMILRPDIAAPAAGQLSFLAAVALAEVLEGILPKHAALGLKWPNDILVGGKKLAGILLETETGTEKSLSWLIIGIGVNITGAPEGAVSLADFGITGLDSGQLLEKLHGRITSLYNVWREKGFDPIRQSWLRYAFNLGNTINVRLPKESFAAKFLGIDAAGALQVEMPDGSQRQISSGEVFAA